MAVILPSGKQHFETSAGLPLSGGKLYTYIPGTSTPKNTFTDSGAGTPNANPVILDTRGEATVFWSGAYDVYLKDASDATIWGPIRHETPEVAGAASDLETRLADETDPAKGAGLVGFDPAQAYSAQTVGGSLRRSVALSQFSGADPTGVTDAVSQLSAMGVAAAAAKAPGRIDGTYLVGSQWIPPRYMPVLGGGKTSDNASGKRGPSVLLKGFDSTTQPAVYVGYDDSGLDGVQIDGNGKTGDLLQLAGSRTFARNVTLTNSGAVALRVGTDAATATDGSTPNTNVWSLTGVQIRNAGTHGILFDDPTAGVDSNGGLMLGGEVLTAGGDGVKFDNSLYNTVVGTTVQSAAGATVRLTTNSRGITWIGGDLEISGSPATLDSGTFGNYIAGAFYGGAGATPALWVNNSRGANKGRNWIVQHDANLAKMKLHDELNIHDPDTGGTPAINGWAEGVGSELNVFRVEGAKAGASGGRVKVQTKAVGGALTDAVTWDETQATVLGGVVAQAATITTLASAGTIAPTKPIHFVSGTTTISTITPPASFTANGGGQITLIPTGLWSTNTAGNIALATTGVVSKALILTYDKTTAKWYPSY